MAGYSQRCVARCLDYRPDGVSCLRHAVEDYVCNYPIWAGRLLVSIGWLVLVYGMTLVIWFLSMRMPRGPARQLPPTKKGVRIGFLIGVLLAVINIVPFLGLLGGFALIISPLFPLVMVFGEEAVLGCHGEGCWWIAMVLGSIWLILLSTLIGYVIGCLIGMRKRRIGRRRNVQAY